MGNIEFLIIAIGAVVFFTLLLVTGNTMAIAVRERTNELAVLKAIGSPTAFVLGAGAGRVAADRGARRRRRAVARERSSRSRTSPAVILLRTCRRSRSPLGAAIALVTGLLAGPAAGRLRRCGCNVATALRRL